MDDTSVEGPSALKLVAVFVESIVVMSNGTSASIDSHSSREYRDVHVEWWVRGCDCSASIVGSRSAASCVNSFFTVLYLRASGASGERKRG
jgi:hypothetical protein